MKPINATCPACGRHGLQLFYSVDGIPVNSCLVVDSAEAGRTFPRGDLRICFCEGCGFITNTAFDVRLPSYDWSYEETQVFSPVFRQFQDDLIERLLRAHQLTGKTVVEIGCGKGDFLARMAELGNIRGIGIDPSSIQERLTGIAAERVRFINEYYGSQHGSIRADFLACRHALEHIPDVSGLLTLIRDSLADAPTPIFFELPETLRVLREGAYWDIYFEHCNYFTPGSLARAFESHGFGVTDVWLGYDDQYLMLEARTSPGGAKSYAATLDQPHEIEHAVAEFERSIALKLDSWREYFAHARRAGKSIAIWGSGSKCVAFLSTIGVDEEVAFVTDVNPYRHGKFIVGTGKQIVAPGALSHAPPDEVIVMNPIYRSEVVAILSELGIETNVITAEAPLEALS